MNELGILMLGFLLGVIVSDLFNWWARSKKP
jgi:hypothetical protein